MTKHLLCIETTVKIRNCGGALTSNTPGFNNIYLFGHFISMITLENLKYLNFAINPKYINTYCNNDDSTFFEE